MIRFLIGMVVMAVVGFIVFIFLGVLIAGSIWSELRYETALPYILMFGAIGFILPICFGVKRFSKKHHK